jgi:hypothetical protein
MTDTTGKTTEADYYFEALCDEGKEISRLKSDIERLTSERDAARNRAIEECAKVADDFSNNAREHEAMPQALAFEMLAKAIRALGGQK